MARSSKLPPVKIDIRLSPALIARLEKWGARNGAISRNEVIRHLLVWALERQEGDKT